jgi:hypothetical protein
MDVVIGPRRPSRPHVEVPYFAFEGAFPKEKDYNLDKDNPYWALDGFKLDESRDYTLDLRFQDTHLACPHFYDVHPKKAWKGFFHMHDAVNFMNPEDKARWEGRLEPELVGMFHTMHVEFGDQTNQKTNPVIKYKGAMGTNDIPDEEGRWRLQTAQKPFSQYDYDGKGFRGFPHRMGWDFHEALDSTNMDKYVDCYRKKAPEDAARFIQAWLYFGMLSTIMGNYVDSRVFTTKNKYGRSILTAQPLFVTKALAARMKAIQSMSQGEVDAIYEEAVHCFDRASRFTGAEDEGLLKFIPFVGELALSIRVLGITLQAMMFSFRDRSEKPREKIGPGQMNGVLVISCDIV